jgi:hypothetical protein
VPRSAWDNLTREEIKDWLDLKQEGQAELSNKEVEKLIAIKWLFDLKFGLAVDKYTNKIGELLIERVIYLVEEDESRLLSTFLVFVIKRIGGPLLLNLEALYDRNSDGTRETWTILTTVMREMVMGLDRHVIKKPRARLEIIQKSQAEETDQLRTRGGKVTSWLRTGKGKRGPVRRNRDGGPTPRQVGEDEFRPLHSGQPA